MWNDVNENIQETDAEQEVISRVHELKEQGDTINEHIDQVMEGAPTKLKVTVNVSDADWRKIQDLLNKQREWVINQAQMTVQEVNTILVEERKKTISRYKEYDGCYLGYYTQWFFWFYFVLGFFLFTAAIVMMVGKWFKWF